MTWSLIVLILGSLPPQGTIQYGFPTQQACMEEAAHYCGRSTSDQFRCKCEQGLLPPGTSPPPTPSLKGRRP